MSKGSIIRRKRLDGSIAYRLKFEAPRTADGKRRTEFRTMPHGTTLKQAEAELRKLLGTVDSGTHVTPTKVTLASYLSKWLDTRRDRGEISPRTLERYSGMFDLYVLPKLGSAKLQQVSRADVQAALDQVWQKLSPGTIRYLRATLSAAFATAVEDGLMAHNPCKGLKLPKAEKRPMRALDSDGVTKLLAAFEGHDLHPIIRTAVGSGLRRGEVLALTWANVDLARGVIHVRQSVEQSKAGGVVVKPGGKSDSATRSVPVTAALIEYLKAYRRERAELALRLGVRPDFETPSSYVFPESPSEPLKVRSPDNFSAWYRQAAVRRGFKGLRFHDLRHTYASVLLAAGAPVKSVSERLGHSDPAILLRVYAHVLKAMDAQTTEIATRVGL